MAKAPTLLERWQAQRRLKRAMLKNDLNAIDAHSRALGISPEHINYLQSQSGIAQRKYKTLGQRAWSTAKGALVWGMVGTAAMVGGNAIKTSAVDHFHNQRVTEARVDFNRKLGLRQAYVDMIQRQMNAELGKHSFFDFKGKHQTKQKYRQKLSEKQQRVDDWIKQREDYIHKYPSQLPLAERYQAWQRVTIKGASNYKPALSPTAFGASNLKDSTMKGFMFGVPFAVWRRGINRKSKKTVKKAVKKTLKKDKKAKRKQQEKSRRANRKK